MSTPPGASFTTPEWVKDAVFYHIFPDRFARSDRVAKPENLESWDSPPTPRGFKGGDLLGVVEHLDYIQDLGATALYLCPIFASVANHRYHTYDYYRVDPLLGGEIALRRLIDEVHRRDMRIVLDGVFNHASRGFFQFNHILENGQLSPYIDWFHVQSLPLNAYGEQGEPLGYTGWYGKPALPKFNTGTEAVREFLFGVAQHWIRFGADGWRLDAAEQIDHEFWVEFRRRIKTVNGDAYILGEVWTEAEGWLEGDQFDGVTNYQLTWPLHVFAANSEEDYPASHLYEDVPGKLTSTAFGARVRHILGLYPEAATQAQLNIIGSHDTPRFAAFTNGDAGAYRLATLFQMTFPGAPSVYYGDEVGATSGPDQNPRQSFSWDESTWDRERLDFTKRCIRLRLAHPVLRRGSFSQVLADDDVYVFARHLDGEWAVVAINTGYEARSIDFSFPANQGPAELRDPWNAERIHRVSNGWVDSWFVPPRDGAVLLGRIRSDA
jgi:cyclomaltodextrinase / maltogenic alpha-amylase / neopullulanase